MSTAWDAQPEVFRAQAASWLAERGADAPPDYGAIVPEQHLPAARRWQAQLAEAGLAGLHWPTRWGGQGLSSAHTAVWLEECARAGVPPFVNMVSHVLTAEALLAQGTDEQRATHLPPLRTGERLWCQLFSEPDAGSDLAALRTTATRHGGTWVLDGSKIWTSNGHVAEWGICLARTDPSAPAHRGISFFLVDMHAPGVDVRPIRQITGAADFDAVFFDGVELPPAALLGDEGAGWAIAMSTLTHERNHIGASAIRLGLHTDDVATTLARRAPVVRDRATERWVAGRATVALGSQHQRLGPAAASLMKLGVGGLSLGAARAAVDDAGPAGTIAGAATSGLLAALAGEIAGGSAQVQRTIIGERLLGLPREPR